MTRIIEVIDKTVRVIYIPKERWTHIVLSHPELSNQIGQIKQTLTKPLTIISDHVDECVNYYHTYIKKRKEYLVVVVKYLNGEGFIITIFYSKHKKK